ncbi:hypothetical protein TWF730_001999 [Orbilia blumenaviensis]|uniref:threonine--tRNA ligase n=1 Tax=Orbilia blumenaviensis TaxID=1796055 RepID=A0AAV9UFU1_9PEZI
MKRLKLSTQKAIGIGFTKLRQRPLTHLRRSLVFPLSTARRPFTHSSNLTNHQPTTTTPPPPPPPTATTTTETTPPPPHPSPQKPTNKTLHHNIATQTGLYSTLPYSPGSPFFLPHGTRIFNRLVEFLRAQYALYGFQEVLTPTIYSDSLWQKSGHLENFREDMFRVVSAKKENKKKHEDLSHGGLNAGVEEEEYSLKPMNCPGHCLLYKVRGHGYHDLPLRFAEFAPLHRDEIRSALTGLTRVRRFHQDDAHIFCRRDQVSTEISSTLSMLETVYTVFGLTNYKFVLSTRPDKYMGTLSDWEEAEKALKASLDESGKVWSVNEGDGAFYGPKIDVILMDKMGKEHQTATVQLDFQLPLKFELSYDGAGAAAAGDDGAVTTTTTTTTGTKETPVIIHRAIFGSLERFMALLIEKFEKRWPFWMSPRQVKVIPVTRTDEIMKFARQTRDILAGVGNNNNNSDKKRRQVMGKRTFFVDLEERNLGLNKALREAKSVGYNVIVVIGESEAGSGEVGWDVWEDGKYVKMPKEGVEGVYQRLVEMEGEYR